MKRLNVAIWVLIVACCLACASRQGAVSRLGTSDIEHLSGPASGPRPEGVKRPPLIYPPQPLRQEPPEYPPEALDSEIGCTARLLYHVEKDGSPSLVRLEWEVTPPDQFLETFDATVRTAVEAWEFKPAYKIVPVELPDGAIEPEIIQVPSAHRALIRFRVIDGRGVVE
jgi:hypothetical protein